MQIILLLAKPAIKAMTNLKVNEGGKKDMSCEATGGPNLDVSWMKKGKDGKFTVLAGQIVSKQYFGYSLEIFTSHLDYMTFIKKLGVKFYDLFF